MSTNQTGDKQVSSNRPSSRGWAWIAGASEGLGAAFAAALARRGYDLLLIARRENLLAQLQQQLQAKYSIQVQIRALDLAHTDLAAQLQEPLTSAPPAIAIYNAAYAPAGPFLDTPYTALEQVVNVNVRGPVLWAATLGQNMRSRGSGALVFMSSLAGNQGSPNIATYAGSKAFNSIFAEGLWSELRNEGIQVLGCCAGAISTPGYAAMADGQAPGTLSPEAIASTTLNAIDRGPGVGPRIVPGLVNRVASTFMNRLLPRRLAIALMGNATKNLGSDHP